MGGGEYLRKVFAWSAEEEKDLAAMMAAGLGMAGPVALGAMVGQLPAGLVAAVGGLLVGNANTGPDQRTQVRNLAAILATVFAALCSVALIAGHGWWTYAAMILLASAAAIIGGHSRDLTVATGRFIVFLVIILSIAESGHDGESLFALMGSGALGTAALAFLFGSLARAVSPGLVPKAVKATPPPISAARRFNHWRRSLRHLGGWQFALRLAFCLTVASIIHMMWLDHRFIWIMLTVAILSQRQIEVVPVKITQSAIGVAIGVAATELIAARTVPIWLLVSVIALLAGARPWLLTRSYLAYSACATPLVVLILDAGKPVAESLLIDRLIATMIGAGLVIAANLVARNLTAKAA